MNDNRYGVVSARGNVMYKSDLTRIKQMDKKWQIISHWLLSYISDSSSCCTLLEKRYNSEISDMTWYWPPFSKFWDHVKEVLINRLPSVFFYWLICKWKWYGKSICECRYLKKPFVVISFSMNLLCLFSFWYIFIFVSFFWEGEMKLESIFLSASPTPIFIHNFFFAREFGVSDLLLSWQYIVP